jgi:hypothetical protein
MSKSTRDRAAVKDAVPINLREQYGHRYRIEHEPAYYAEHGSTARIGDLWLQMIPGRHGHIFPFGGTTLAASSNTRGPVAKRLIATPYCRVWQDGTDGVMGLFDARYLKQVARIIRTHATRRHSEAHRRDLIAAGAARCYAAKRDRTRFATTVAKT